jgi:hypothetical protein
LLGLGGTSPKDGSGATTTSEGPTEGEVGGNGEGCREADTSPERRGGVEYRSLFRGEGDGEGAADVQKSIIDWFWARGMSGDDERKRSGEGLGDGGRELFHRPPLSIAISSESSAPLRENWLGLGLEISAPTQAFVFFRVVCRFLSPSTAVLARLSLVLRGFAEVAADVEAARLGTNNPASISSSVSSSNPASSSNLVTFSRFLTFCLSKSSATLTKPVQAPGGMSRVGSLFRLRFLLGTWVVLSRDFSVADRSYSSISITISRH